MRNTANTFKVLCCAVILIAVFCVVAIVYMYLNNSKNTIATSNNLINFEIMGFDSIKANEFEIKTINSTDAQIVKYNGNSKNVKIPININGYKITKIGHSAFENNKIVEKVVLNDNINTIADYAFYNCENLKEIFIPNKVRGIAYATFKNCYNLQKVVTTSSVQFMAYNAFENCEKVVVYAEPASVMMQICIDNGIKIKIQGDLTALGGCDLEDVIVLEECISNGEFNKEYDVDLDGKLTTKDRLLLVKQIGKIKNDTPNRLENKKGVFYGDSICLGKETKTGGWATYIQQRTKGFESHNYGINGATYLTSYKKLFKNKTNFEKVEKSADYVLIEGFTNGMYGAKPKKPLGKIDMQDFTVTIENCKTDTYSGEMEKYILKCIDIYGHDKISFVISFKGARHYRQLTAYQKFQSEMINCCKKYKIPIMSLYEEVKIPFETQEIKDEYYYISPKTNHSDDTHLNKKGNEIISKKILEWIKTI